MRSYHSHRAFTLVELLVVVAIIAILAAIAVPNMLNAQTRAKTSRALADLRTIGLALETYATDWNISPPCNPYGTPGNRHPAVEESFLYLERLSTPTSYLADAFPADPFEPTHRLPIASHIQIWLVDPEPISAHEGPQWRSYSYTSWNSEGRTTAEGTGFDIHSLPRTWLLQSSGPDRLMFNTGGILANFSTEHSLDLIYDPTNGVVSFGSIFRIGGEVSSGHGQDFDRAVRAPM